MVQHKTSDHRHNTNKIFLVKKNFDQKIKAVAIFMEIFMRLCDFSILELLASRVYKA